LIIEDDVDWDIRLRTVQIPVTASAFRSLTSNYNVNGLSVGDYWGDVANWDIRKCDVANWDIRKCDVKPISQIASMKFR
jgi:hypothetical protein